MSTVYVTKAEFTRQKARLTRAKNSGDPLEVLAAVEKTMAEWRGKAWPDDWSRWSVALDDAYYAYVRSDAYDDDEAVNEGRIAKRFREAFDEIHL